MEKINRSYKDRVFIDLFGNDINNALSLYNAINGTTFTDASDLEFNTLEDAIYMNMKNDVSFLFNDEISLLEQQGTYNPNMPYRGLEYMAALLSRYVKEHELAIYSSTRIELPTPRFYVLYNGERDAPVESELRFTDLCTPNEEGLVRSDLEVVAHIFNVNASADSRLFQACTVLYEYAELVGTVRRFVNMNGLSHKEAISQAIDYCINNNILKEYLEKRKSEVIEKMLFEYNEAEEMRKIDSLIKRLEKKAAEAEEKAAEAEEKAAEAEEKAAEAETGEARMAQLVSRLMDVGRLDDVKKITADPSYRDELYKEFGLI